MRIGIVFGGFSREREISFAGGRTVYDNLDKNLFEAVPLFVDSFGNYILLNWEFIYKGSIRDFYPPVNFLPAGNEEYQLYAESLGREKAGNMAAAIGKPVKPEELPSLMEMAFLCLHGPYGEDGKVQRFLQDLGIPYTGSGIRASEIGINKALQKGLMVEAGFNSPAFLTFKRADILERVEEVKKEIREKIAFPMVVKAANQGSSIGVSIIESAEHLEAALKKALFIHPVSASLWHSLKGKERTEFVRSLCDIREGAGLPAKIGSLTVMTPAELTMELDRILLQQARTEVVAADGDEEVVVEGFIAGKEFSCIVIQDEKGHPVALPPTEIRKGKELFDYRSKYLPGLSRKITPIEESDEDIMRIRTECERLFGELKFDVYARIDGFLGKDGRIFLNDPNTTSGMMPSSFFFHQAAEIGLDPSRFLTYIIRTSLVCRSSDMKEKKIVAEMLVRLDHSISHHTSSISRKKRVAVILGGYSSERHISVESGRNIYEKLASSVKYAPVPVFLTGHAGQHKMFVLPVNMLLKDNADDIREKIEAWKVHPVIQRVMDRCSDITRKYTGAAAPQAPEPLDYSQMKERFDAVFIALHGRPGEDGAVQKKLDELGIPYNGSGVKSSAITIDKYQTCELLKQHGFLVAEHLLIEEEDWRQHPAAVIERIRSVLGFPFIAKPVDDGCSSAVKRIKSAEEWDAFATLMFRNAPALPAAAAEKLKIKPKEEFPRKNVILAEELISAGNARHFLEITGGMLTRYGKNGELEYEVFEASEALAEGDVLSLEEKFLAGQGQNITPARYSKDPVEREKISAQVKHVLGAAAKVLGVEGYCRIDAFVRIFSPERVEVIFIEVNSLPGMTPATCIFHQCAIQNYKPLEFIDRILTFGEERAAKKKISE
ncbi:MAG: D-alanine--D-alanine ligase [Bacteroidia bacterium]|nr:D-alanine--D-alanine ligase [Bacteroidia bacterium]